MADRRSLNALQLGPGGLRYLLAFAVVLFHATRWVPVGHAAVYLFFVLSGYWMSRMYTRTYARMRQPLRAYWTSRALRIYPLYSIALALTLAANAAYAAVASGPPSPALSFMQTPGSALRNLVVFGLYGSQGQVIVPAWSLDVELQFYVLLPLIVALRERIGRPVLAGLAFASIGLTLSRLWAGLPSYALDHLAFFLTGMALDRGADAAPVFSRRARAAANLLAASVFALPYVWSELGHAVFHARSVALGFVNVWEAYNIGIALLLVPLVDANVRRPSSGRDRALGGISYALYLIHWSLLSLYGATFHASAGSTKAIALCGYVIASALCAFLLYRYVDTPLEALRRRWLERQAAEPRAAAAPVSS